MTTWAASISSAVSAIITWSRHVEGNVHILIVEDNAADARLIEKAIHEHSHQHLVSTVADGRTAMAFLQRQEPYAQRSLPDLLLLDLNLPYKSGREVLMECKADPALRHIPIVIFTSTQANEEVHRAYNLGAAAYCVKPIDLDSYLSLIVMIVEFWGHRARLAIV